MAFQAVFKRYELKYLISGAQKARILAAMEPHMELDQYGRDSIRNIYFDTDSFLLIRRSIEKPKYKEKLRVRGYGEIGPESMVYVELKKKYRSVVYKRRIRLPYGEAMAWLTGGQECPMQDQISREIDQALHFYEGLRPRVCLSYEREAYYAKDGSDFRVTFDENVFARQTDLSLVGEPYGASLLKSDQTLMEIKCSGGIPLWLVRVLSAEKIYKTSFSKYGTVYQNMIFPGLRQSGFTEEQED